MASFISRIQAIGFAALAMQPSQALACAVCFTANGRSVEVYYWTTAFLMLLPLGIATAAIFWILSRSKRPSHRDR